MARGASCGLALSLLATSAAPSFADRPDLELALDGGAGIDGNVCTAPSSETDLFRLDCGSRVLVDPYGLAAPTVGLRWRGVELRYDGSLRLYADSGLSQAHVAALTLAHEASVWRAGLAVRGLGARFEAFPEERFIGATAEAFGSVTRSGIELAARYRIGLREFPELGDSPDVDQWLLGSLRMTGRSPIRLGIGGERECSAPTGLTGGARDCTALTHPMTFGSLRVAVVVPAFDEEALIAKTIRSVPDWVDEVIVVDDGSTDRTSATAREAGGERVSVVRHEVNRGVGAAIATGYRLAFDRGADAAAVMAGDAQMDPRDLDKLVEPIARGAADYVKGDRLAHPAVRSEMPLSRFLGNHVLTWMTRLAVGRPSIGDSQCGYTVLSRVACRNLDLEAVYPRYGYPNDVFARLHAAGMRIASIVVHPIYGSEKSGITLWTALVRIPLLLLRIFGRRIARSWTKRSSAGVTHQKCA